MKFISDTIFDSVSHVLRELAWYTVTEDYTDDQIQEVIESLVTFNAIGINYDEIGHSGDITEELREYSHDQLLACFFVYLKVQKAQPGVYPDELKTTRPI